MDKPITRRRNELTPVGKFVARALLEMNWTWTVLAEELGVSRQRVSQIARTKRLLPATVNRLADAIGVEPAELLALEDKADD